MNILTLIVGNPSTGKTTSLRNLGKDTFIVNVEQKALPFPASGSVNYPLGDRVASVATATKAAIPAMSTKEHLYFIIENLKSAPQYKFIVFDSFSAYTDKLLAECKNKFKGFDVWNAYNYGIYEFFQKLKEIPDKFIFIIAHVEYLQDADGNMITRTKAKGKEWEGLVEKEVTCVLYSRYIRKEVGNGVNYQFVTNSDGYLPGKTPMAMFDVETELYVPNDLAEVIKRYKAYYKLGDDLRPAIVASMSAQAKQAAALV